ncbi:MAG: CotH kinase family protein, partial [Desulfofustis sp.]|nr:CotH kinase family protein [Desulfofustis sp.]
GTLIDAFIDGRFHRSQQIIKQGHPIDSIFNSINMQKGATPDAGVGTILIGRTPEVTQLLPNGIDAALYKGTLPGKKNKGYCTYVAKLYRANMDTAIPSPGRPLLLPKVTIRTEEQNLYGEQGILDNKDQHGRNWEKPATLAVINDKPIVEQKIGLRFHGGSPGRKKDIESFRLYARSRFGKSHIDAESILGRPGKLDFRTLVLKYTYQVLQDTPVDLNPFVHSFALDIGNRVNALVPRHALIDLTVNDEHKGLFLAMEHPAERTIADWLGHENFVLYKYKSHNTDHESVPLFSVAYRILKKRGEETLQELKEHLAIDNVINSILLSAYVADDDSCQGVEIISQNEESTEITVTNWDLDHSFLSTAEGKAWVDPSKYSLHLLRPDKKTACIRQWIFGWTYLQSATFRSLVKDRLEELLDTSLSPEKLDHQLDYYRKVNEQELGGRYHQAIDDLEMYIQKRPAALRRQFARLNQKVASIDRASVKW